MTAFKQFLVGKQADHTPIGDLARDVAEDPGAPDEYGALRLHLERVGCPDEVLELVDEAHDAYRRDLGDQR